MNIFVLVLLGSCIADRINYQQYKVIRTRPETHQDLQLLQQFVEREPSMDFWNSPHELDTDIDVMVPPALKKEFENFLYTRNIDSKILIDDVQNLINKEQIGQSPRCAFGWTQYPTLAQIDAWLYSLPKLYKKVVQVIIVGNTFEGRNITGAYLSYSKKNKNKAVFIEANIHGREWISSAATTFIFNELLTSKDPEVRRVAERHDWYFVPVANPDGFFHSHEKNRNWSKTRQSHGFCDGADAGRNWDNHFKEHDFLSWTTCTSTYPGPEPFSEPCTRTLSEYISTIGDKLVAYLSFHSYGQVLGIPYAHSPDPLDNYDLTYNIGLKVAKKIAERYGTQYKVGNIYNVKGPAGGFSVDWVKATFQTPLVYNIYLRDLGKKGYFLPPDQIVPTGLETLDGIVTMLNAFETEQRCSPLDYD